MTQTIMVEITALAPYDGADPRRPVIKSTTVRIDIDKDDAQRPGGRSAQKADIENQIVKALNDVGLAMAKARGESSY